MKAVGSKHVPNVSLPFLQDVRKFFIQMVEKLVEPMRHAKWNKQDVETFFDNARVAFAAEVCDQSYCSMSSHTHLPDY